MKAELSKTLHSLRLMRRDLWIGKSQFPALFKQVSESMFTPALITTAFRKCGISPFDPKAGSDVLVTKPDIAPAESKTSLAKTCKVILYADDTAIIYSDKQKEQIEKHLNDDMAIVKTWLDENKLTLNVKKTKSMLIGNKKLLNEAEHLDVRLDMDSIEQVGAFKYLGVWLDSSLKFTYHISKMSSKISSAIGVISRVSR